MRNWQNRKRKIDQKESPETETCAYENLDMTKMRLLNTGKSL